MRADFPYRAGRVDVNSAGAGLPVPGAAEAAASHFRELAAHGATAQPAWLERSAAVRVQVGELLGVPSPEVQFFRGTSELLILAAASVRWRPGDEVVVASDDFPSIRLPWGQAEAAGAVVRWVDVGDAEERTDRLLAAITAQTRVVAVTHVHATTGTRVDLDALGRACRAVDALLLVDGVEALGAIPVDLGLVDVYSSATFKWLLSGMGLGVGFVGERARTAMTPVHRGYRNPPPSDRLEYVEPSFPLLDVLATTLGYVGSLGWPAVHERVATLTAMVADQVETLAERGVDVVHKGGFLRVSPHFYNTREDVERFGAALREVLVARGER